MGEGIAREALEGLYAALSATGAATSPPAGAAGLDAPALLDLIGELQAIINVAEACQTLAIAHVTAQELTLAEDGTDRWVHHGLGHTEIDAPSMIAPRLGVSEITASHRASTAVEQAVRTPELIAEMAAGTLGSFAAYVVTDETHDAPPEVAAAIVATLRDEGHLATLTPGPLRRRARAQLAKLAPEVLSARAEADRARRGLYRTLESPATDRWEGSYPAELSRPAWAAIDRLAQEMVRDGRADTIAHARADAHMQLLLGQVTAVVHLHATTAATLPDHPEEEPTAGADATPGAFVEVSGFGAPGTTILPTESLAGATHDGTVTCHPNTGAALAGDIRDSLAPTRASADHPRASVDTGARGASGDSAAYASPESPAYRPPAAMARLVRFRDGHCRFPGCSVNARFTDLDHVTAWPAGPTAPTNLMSLCRRHHRIKQRLGWHARLDPDGTVTWTDPTGLRRTTAPVDHLAGRSTLPAPPPGSAPPTGRADPQCCHPFSFLEDTLERLILAHDTAPPPSPPPRPDPGPPPF